jgi:hypothetical protein
MVISNFPEEYYENLTATEQTIVDDWTKKRQLLVRNKVAKSIEDSVKDQSPLERTSVPYIRVLVKSLRRSKQKVRRLAKKQNIAAELTIWRVSEEQLHLMKEGTVVRMKNVCVRSDHDGILQLSANGDTHTESLSSQSTQIQLIRSGYEERRPKSLIHINLIAKKSVAGKSICMFVLAMDKYAEVKKIVEPKEAKLAESMKLLDVANKDLKEK